MLPLFSLQPVSYSCPLFFIVPLSIANSIQNEVKCEESLDENYSLKPLVKNHETEKSKDANSYEERAIEELKIYNRRNKKKFWTNEEDDLLLKLADETTLTWKQITKNFSDTNQYICERRYFRLKSNEENWSKEDEQKIKYMKEVENKKWNEIQRQIKGHTAKQIRQRYINYISSEIVQKPWEIDEDLVILRSLKENGNKWKMIGNHLEGRSQNQIKNRYYGTLIFIDRKVKMKIKREKQKQRLMSKKLKVQK